VTISVAAKSRSMRLQAAYTGPPAQRVDQEPLPFGASWPDVGHKAHVIFVHEKEPHEPGGHLHLLLAGDAERNEIGQKRLVGWG